jgi:hypothetical protein
VTPPPNMALQRTRALAFARVRSPLNACSLCVGGFQSASSARHHAARSAVPGDRTAAAWKRQNQHRGERTRFEELLARQGLGINEVAAA